MFCMKFFRVWILLSFILSILFFSIEIHYEDYARVWESALTDRSPSMSETPGFLVNKYTLRFYSNVTGENNHSMWSYPIRLLISTVYLASAICLAFLFVLTFYLVTKKNLS